MDITKTLKERFCKDNNISIKVFHEPYFTERLELFDRVMPENNIVNKYNQFLEYLTHFETEEEYFDEYARIKNEAILAIKNNPKYQEFNTMDFNKNGIKYNLPYPEKEIYKNYNVGHFFISIDMVKANFTALNCYSPEIFNNKPTWIDFLSQFTDAEYIHQSKYIRQVIMGNCNPSRQISYEKYLMGKLLSLFDNDEIEVISVKSDEIIIDVTKEVLNSSIKDIHNKFQTLVMACAKEINERLNVTVELFHIEPINQSAGYKRLYYDGEKNHHEFKCLNAIEAPKAFRQVLGEEPTENDNVFIYEGRLAKFIDN